MKIKLLKIFPCISSQNLNHNLSEYQNMIDSLIYYSKYQFRDNLSYSKEDMRKNNLLNSEFSNEYKKISKQIADVYISKYQMSDKKMDLVYQKHIFV